MAKNNQKIFDEDEDWENELLGKSVVKSLPHNVAVTPDMFDDDDDDEEDAPPAKPKRRVEPEIEYAEELPEPEDDDEGYEEDENAEPEELRLDPKAPDLSNVTEYKKLEDGTEIIDGKEYKPYQFKPGNKGSVVREAKRKVKEAELAKVDPANLITIVRKAKDVREIRIWAKTYGMTRMLQIMENSSDGDFVKLFTLMAPYLLPRLNAVDFKEGNLSEKNAAKAEHTVTVKDMTKNKTYKIADE